MTKLNKYLCYLGLSVLIIVLDQCSKLAIVDQLALHDAHPMTSFFSIVRAHNYGAAFGFLNDASIQWQTVFFSVVAIGLSLVMSVWIWRVLLKEPATALALAFIIGGAIGNLIDRLLNGYVVDFISVHGQSWQFPAFNIADSAICLGAIILILESFGVFSAKTTET